MDNAPTEKALNLDINQQQSFVRYYRNLSEKPATTVRFFNHSDYYTIHGDDVNFATEDTLAGYTVKQMGEEPQLSYICLNKSNFQSFIRQLLLIKQYRVEVYTKAKQSKNCDWLLEFKGSPGNLSQFEDILFDDNTDIVVNSKVMGIKICKNKMLAVSCVNSTENIFHITEFTDNDFFTELEALIVQTNPKECVIQIGDTPELTNLKKMLDRSGIMIIKVKRTEFEANDVHQDLNRLLYFGTDQQRNCLGLTEANQVDGIGSLQAVIKYLDLTADESNFNQYKLKVFDVQRYVRLDNAAVSALNLFPNIEAVSEKKNDSVFGVLDTCSTQQGKRLLEQWLTQPLRDLNRISERLDVVESLVNDSETRITLTTNCLSKIPDLLVLAKKLGSKKANLYDCYRVYQTVNYIPSLVKILRDTNNTSVKALAVDPISESLSDLEKYQTMIEQTIDMDLVDRGEYFIKSTFDDELNELYTQKQDIEEKMQKSLRTVARELGFDAGKSIKMESNDQLGYYYRITLKDETIIRNNADFKIIDAVKNGVRFVNDRLVDLNEAYQDIKINYEKQQKSIVKDIVDIAAGYGDSIRNLNMCIGVVDVLVSMANAAANAPIPYIRPSILPLGSGILKLKQVRHPCLERHDGMSFIPNDVEFKKDEKVVHIITGPNMGGKSTFMRSVGVNILLAHIGSFVACEEAEISLVDCIFARVGADDSELKGLSTFMMEMVESCGIIRSATPNSLVIIDELGRGTSTFDGFGLAWAIVEYLAKEAKSFTLFATHYHELTQLEEEIPTVVNVHVTAVVTENALTPLYQLKEGPSDKSYGIHCARLCEFPEDVIQIAEEQQAKLEDTDGMKFIKDMEYSLKRKEIIEGDRLIKEGLEELRSLDLKNLPKEEFDENIKKFKDRFKSENNLFIKGLVCD